MGDSEPGIDISPDDVLMLEIGVLLQQLLLLHDHTIGRAKPSFDEDAYDALIKSLWQRTIHTTAIPPLFGAPVGEACHNLHMYWQKAVEERFDGRYVNAKWSFIGSEVEQIASLIERALPPTERSALWYRAGKLAANGRSDQITGHWAIANEVEFQQCITALGITRTDLFAEPLATAGYPTFPAQFRAWKQLEAGIANLAAIARRTRPEATIAEDITKVIAGPRSGKPKWDEKDEVRNRWIHEQVCKAIPYQNIVSELAVLAAMEKWGPINSHSHLREIAKEVAKRFGLEAPPDRQPKRKRGPQLPER